MSHVDDGILHALLDGALAAADHAEAERVELHLGACPDCRARLDEAARLREQAGALLASAQPCVVAAPPFEEIRARARALDASAPRHVHAHGRRRAVLATPFNGVAWAATVVLAVGLGWLLHDTIEQPERVAVSDMSEAAAPDFDQAAASGSPGDLSIAGDGASAIEGGAAPTPESDAAPPVAPGAGARADTRNESTQDAAVTERAATQGFQTMSPQPAPAHTQARPPEYDVAEEAAPEAGGTGAVDAAAGRPLQTEAARSAAPPPPPPPAAAAAQDASLADGWRASTPDAAARHAGQLVQLDGAEVVSAATRGSGSTAEVRTVQMTEQGELVTVVQRRLASEGRSSAQRAESQRRAEATAGAAEAAPAEDALPMVTVQLEDWLVTISGAVPRHRLEQLAEEIR